MLKNGKDACISYGGADFKFKNNNNFPIKILANNTSDSIAISLVEIPL